MSSSSSAAGQMPVADRPGPSLQLILSSLLRADAITAVKNRRSVFISVLLPLVILFVVGRPKSEARLGGALIIIGLAITYGLLSTGVIGYAIAMSRDREHGVFQRLRVTPAPTWAIMVSRLAVQVVANLVISLVVVIVGSIYYHVTFSVGQYIMVLVISLIGSAVFLGIGQALVGLVKSAETVNAASRIVFIALIFLGLLGLEGILGGSIESISRWSPVGTMMTLYTAVLKLSAWGSRDWLALLACFGYVVVFAAIGIRWFQWESH